MNDEPYAPKPYSRDEVARLKTDIRRLAEPEDLPVSVWIAKRLIATVEHLQSELDRITKGAL